MLTKRKIRVLECIRQGQVGGGESHLLSLVENLDRSVFEPVVLSFTDGPMVKKLRDAGVSCTVIYTERPFDFTKWGKVKNFIRENKIDLVHAHGTRANSNILWPARSLKVPVIYTVHGWSFHDDQPTLVKRLRILGEKYLTTRSTKNISVSESNKNSGAAYLKHFDSTVVANGIDQRKFSPDKRFADIRAELGIPKEALVVVFIARLTVQKQPKLLIEAFNEAAKTQANLHLLMVGDGELKEEVISLASNSVLRERITLQPFRSDIPDILAAADIFVLPSLWEGLPIGLLEAMAMGKAVIASAVDGTKEVITDGENGILVSPGDTAGLTEALQLLGTDEALRNKLQVKARETVSANYNAGYMTRKIEKIYHDVLETTGVN